MTSRHAWFFFLGVSVMFSSSCGMPPQQSDILESAQGDLDVEYSQNTHTIAKYDVFEIAFQHDANYPDPFCDVTIDVVFTSPSKKQIRVGGFHYGSSSRPTIQKEEVQTQRGSRQQVSYHFDKHNLWKARLAPSETGKWTYEFVFQNTEGKQARGTGTFICVEGQKPKSGFVHQHPANRLQ